MEKLVDLTVAPQVKIKPTHVASAFLVNERGKGRSL